MKITLLFTVILFVFSSISYSQTKEDAENFVKNGMKLVDEGDITGGIEEIKKGLKIEPKNPVYLYELALAYYKLQKHDKVVEILEKAIKSKDSFDIMYSVLGNSYDILGDRDQAIEIYEAGLKKFPNSGKIYLEMGVVALSEKEIEKALGYFEKGIKVEPTHPSNYYWASLIYSGSTMPMWGIIYGEIFLNIEQGTKRSENISKLLYDTYSKSITVSDSAGKKNISIKLNGNKTGIPDGSFESDYEMVVLLATLGVVADSSFNGMNLKTISKLRENFNKFWFEKENIKNKSNVLFDYQKSMIQSGVFNAYNYYLMAYGNTDEFNKWAKENSAEAKEFDIWFNSNFLNINKETSLYRKKSN